MTDPADKDLDLSPDPTIDSLTKLIGVQMFEQLSSILGGRRLHIPFTPGPHTPLTVAIGLEAARRVSARYAGATFDVPLTAGKYAQIRALHAEGLNHVQIAHKVRVSRFTVMRVLKQAPKEPTPDLFSNTKEL